MGYFESVAEADKWLATLKKVYPQAFVSEAPHSQPDMMSNTHALRILQIGQVASVQRGADRLTATNSRTLHGVQARAAEGKEPAPVAK
jgi:cystathionine beta-lyase family protein involved in aluminum resistance